MSEKEHLNLLESAWIRAAVLVLIFAGILTRFMYLISDPPGFFKKTSRALLTDPYNLTYFARNKVLFGDWDIFDYNRWMAFKYSAVSLISYIWFKLFGVSRMTANLGAVTLSFLGTAVICGIIYRKNHKAGLITSVLLFSNMILNLYGRHPFLENGLIFLSSGLFGVYVLKGKSWWGLILTGLLAALCVLSGKLFGIVLAVPVLLVILVQERNHFSKRAGLFMGSFLLSMVFLSMLYYGSDLEIVYSYISEQTVGMYGPPDALQSPLAFVEQFMTLGGSSLTFHFNPVLMVLLFFVSLLFLVRPDNVKLLRENRELLYLVGWLIAGFLLLSFPNYRPLRYQLFLFLPACGIIGFIFSTPIDHKAGGKIGWIIRIFTLLVCWYFAEQIIMAILRPLDIDAPGLAYRMVWYTLPVGMIMTGLVVYYRRPFLRFVSSRGIFLTILLGLYLIFQGQWTWRWFTERSYIIESFGKDCCETLGEDAVVIGPYAQTLTINSNIKSFIYMFGLSNREPDLFKRFPLTHLATDKPNFDAALVDYPQLRGSLETVNGTLKYTFINLIRINNEVLKAEDVNYRPSDYEKGIEFFVSNQTDSTGYYLERFLAKYPENGQGLMLAANHYARLGEFTRCREFLDRGKSLYYGDFSYIFEVAYIYYKIALVTGEVQAMVEADKLFKRSAELNPDIASQIQAAKAQAERIYKK